MAKVNRYNEDEELTVKINRTHIAQAKKYITPYKREFILTLSVVLVSTVANMSAPYLLQVALDEKIPNKDIRGLMVLGVIFACTIVISIIAARIRMRCMNIAGQGIIYDIRRDLFGHLQQLPFTYYDSRPHGKILVRVVNYVNSLADMFSNGIVTALTELFSLLVILGFMFAVDVKLTLISLLGMPIFIFCVFKIKGAHRKAWQAHSNKNSNLNAYLHESINGVRITQAFVREHKNKRLFQKLCLENMTAWMKAKSIELTIFPMTQIISQGTVCALYTIAAMLILQGQYTVGMIVAIVNYVWRFWTPITNISNVYNSVMTNAAYLDRILETLGEDVEIKDVPGAYELPDVRGRVEFQNVSFSYDDGYPILQNLSFTVEPGESIALVGATGAGKSTIVNLLSRYYDIQEGKILIDGHDISKVTVSSLRAQLGYMLQDSFVFSGTIMENIRYGKLDATDEEVRAAARAVNADEFIMNFKDGYQTYVSERGSTLSAGQRQLISLARAMLRDPHILILDEATSSIDTETEKKLIDGINQLLKNRTSFIIAHRLSTIRGSDRIMVIGKKNIIEQGTHDELMALKGEYYKLYVSQNSL